MSEFYKGMKLEWSKSVRRRLPQQVHYRVGMKTFVYFLDTNINLVGNIS